MKVHFFQPEGVGGFGERGETFQTFIQRHYGIVVEVHEPKIGPSIIDFLKNNKEECLTSSILFSSLDDGILTLDDSVYCEINKILTKEPKFHLGGIVITKSDDIPMIKPSSIGKIFEGMFDVPIITIPRG